MRIKHKEEYFDIECKTIVKVGDIVVVNGTSFKVKDIILEVIDLKENNDLEILVYQKTYVV